jgi:hypothetical protein
VPGLVVALEGPSGAGKSTVSRLLSRRPGWVLLAEAYDRLSPRPPLDYGSPRELEAIERALLAEEFRRYREARAQAAAGHRVVADTGFAGPLTYTWALARQGVAPRPLLRQLVDGVRPQAAEGSWGVPDLAVWLRTTEPTRVARAKIDPIRHPPRLDARHAAVAREEFSFYRGPLARIYPGLVRTVSGAGTPEAVVARILREVERARPPPPGPGRPSALLDALADPASVP